MLQTIHERAKGWIAGVIIGILSVIFALWGIQYYLHGSSAENIVATVNGEEISKSELHSAYQQLRQQTQAQFGRSLKLTPELQRVLRKQALDNLINREVVAQAATENGFRISPSQVSAVIQQMPSFQVDGKFSPTRFRTILSNLAYSEQSFVRQLEQSLLIGQLQIGMTGSAFSLPNEVKRAVRLAEQTRDIHW